jgi:hypothetical protein
LYTIVYMERGFFMRNEGSRGHDKDRDHRGERHKRKDKDSHHRGAKTFRRGRAIAFLEMMNTRRSTLKQQLQTSELQSINPILTGELKAIDMVINDFVQLFELHELEAMETEQELENLEIGKKSDETN